MENSILQINYLTWIVLIVEIVIGLGLVFLTSYLKKRAGNIADKSDLKELTDIVESVKQEYSKETEILKANLQVLTSKKTDILNEEKEALLDFYHELNVGYI